MGLSVDLSWNFRGTSVELPCTFNKRKTRCGSWFQEICGTWNLFLQKVVLRASSSFELFPDNDLADSAFDAIPP